MTAVRRIGRLLKELVLMEVAIYASLGRWIARRPAIPGGGTRIDYGQLAGPMILLFALGSAVEVIVVDVLANRWLPVLRIPLLVVGAWGVLWMIGLYAAYRVRPHVLTEQQLLLRGGLRATVELPVAAITSLREKEHELPGLVKSLHLADQTLLLGVSSRTNLELVLSGPTELATSQGPLIASRVGIWVDDPRAVARLLRPTGAAASRRPDPPADR